MDTTIVNPSSALSVPSTPQTLLPPLHKLPDPFIVSQYFSSLLSLDLGVATTLL
jgi:hypothetical protein